MKKILKKYTYEDYVGFKLDFIVFMEKENEIEFSNSILGVTCFSIKSLDDGYLDVSINPNLKDLRSKYGNDNWHSRAALTNLLDFLGDSIVDAYFQESKREYLLNKRKAEIKNWFESLELVKDE